MIEVRDLSKQFGAVRALDGVSFTARRRQDHGSAGTERRGQVDLSADSFDGAAGRSRQRAQSAARLAAEPLRARRALGVLPHMSGSIRSSPRGRTSSTTGGCTGSPRARSRREVTALLTRLDLDAIADRKAKGFSQGERTKVALARALVHDPQHLLLDEPTNGLDVMATRHLREWLRELRAKAVACCCRAT